MGRERGKEAKEIEKGENQGGVKNETLRVIIRGNIILRLEVS